MLCISSIKENIKSLSEQREKNIKVLQEKMKLNKKEAQHFNPVSASIFLKQSIGGFILFIRQATYIFVCVCVFVFIYVYIYIHTLTYDTCSTNM